MLSKDLFGKIQVTPSPMVEPESVPVQMSRKPENPNQYKLFMRPQELMDTIKYSVDEADVPRSVKETGDREQVMSYLWNRKTKELGFKSRRMLVDNIKDNGILRPVTIEDNPGKPLSMGQGHHRVAASKLVEQETGKQVYIPVVYSGDFAHTDKEELFPRSLEEKQFRNKELGFDKPLVFFKKPDDKV